MNHQPLQFNNLRNMLPTEESKTKLSAAIGVPVTQINAWLDLDNKSVPYADSLVKMTKYFGCSCDYLLDKSNIKDKPDDVKKLIDRFCDFEDK